MAFLFPCIASSALVRGLSFYTSSMGFYAPLIGFGEALIELYKPVIEHFKPTIEPYKPVIELYEPMMEPYEPIIEHFKPVMEHFKAVIEPYKPMMESYDSLIEHFKPVMEHFKPVIEPYKPVIEPYDSLIEPYKPVIEYFNPVIAYAKRTPTRHKEVFMEDYIPAKEADVIDWSGNLIAVSKENRSIWDLPEPQLTELETLHTQVKALHEQCQTPAHTPLDIQKKNELKTALIEKERRFVRFHLQNNEKMTDAGRMALRIPIHDEKPTHHPLPESHPVITTESKNPFELILHIRDSKTGKRARPEHTNGAVLFWEVSEQPITSTKELKNSLLITRTPHSMRFTPEERGKLVYMAGQWQNGTGEKGLWSEMVSAVIP
ncbi:hypothetical protein Holit_02879 [Hollandina sp. SP2]